MIIIVSYGRYYADHYNHEEEDDQVEAFSDDDFYFLSTLVSVPLTTQICSAHHSSRSISYFALIICASIATMRTTMAKEKYQKWRSINEQDSNALNYFIAII